MNNKTLHDPKTTKSVIIAYTESLEAQLAKTGATTLTAAEVTISKLELAEKFKVIESEEKVAIAAIELKKQESKQLHETHMAEFAMKEIDDAHASKKAIVERYDAIQEEIANVENAFEFEYKKTEAENIVKMDKLKADFVEQTAKLADITAQNMVTAAESKEAIEDELASFKKESEEAVKTIKDSVTAEISGIKEAHARAIEELNYANKIELDRAETAHVKAMDENDEDTIEAIADARGVVFIDKDTLETLKNNVKASEEELIAGQAKAFEDGRAKNAIISNANIAKVKADAELERAKADITIAALSERLGLAEATVKEQAETIAGNADKMVAVIAASSKTISVNNK